MDDTLFSRLLTVMRTVTGDPSLDYATPPERLHGGFWAELVAFRLTSAPDGMRGDLVARVMPDPALAAKETAVQAEVAAAGFATPAVRLSGGPEAGLDRAFMVMDRADGAPLLAGLVGTRAVLGAPRLLARIPATLAQTMADLHRLDPAPVRARLKAGGDVPSVPGMLGVLGDGAAACDRGDLVRAVDWLVANPPPVAPDVVCHGDLHPFNLLVDSSGRVTVLDWSAALLGQRAYDVAFTSLVLAEPPIGVPRPLRPMVRAGGRWLSRRFVTQYRRRSGVTIDAPTLRWYQGVVCARALVEVAFWVTAAEVESRRGHPWLVSGSAFAGRLSRLTGTAVRPS